MVELRQRIEGRTLHVTSPASFGDVLGSIAVDPTLWMALLEQVPFRAASWECPPLVDLDRPFACVLMDHPHLATMPLDEHAFEEHFEAGRAAVHFRNLGGDSDLIAPCPRAGRAPTHLLAWARHATDDEARALWTLVYETLLGRLSDAPTWLSTAGMGVGWLHVRLDPRPKYYRYTPFRTP